MRCAIYTRKSADEAHDSQHSTIETQRELCERYVADRAGEGWALIEDRYDDLGSSGGTLARPALQRLFTDLSAGLIDIVVVYKIDRLSRELRDFLNLLDTFKRAGVEFVSITQDVSMKTSIERLTANVMMVFAQFERELMGERRRDWVAGARGKGLWTSGQSPYGYDLHKMRLVPNPEQAEVVRAIYRRFPKVRDFWAVAEHFNALGHRNRLGRPFSGRNIRRILEYRVYRGEITHRGLALPGAHEAIVSEAVWQRAQAAIGARAAEIAGKRQS